MMRPVFSAWTDWTWLITSVCMDRTTVTSLGPELLSAIEAKSLLVLSRINGLAPALKVAVPETVSVEAAAA